MINIRKKAIADVITLKDEVIDNTKPDLDI